MTIFNEYLLQVLCMLHNFVRQFAVLSPLRPHFSLYYGTPRPPLASTQAYFLCILIKIEKLIRDLFVLVTNCSQLSYIIMVYISIFRRFPFGSLSYMHFQGSKVKVFSATAFVLSIVGAVSYLLSYLLATDGTDYFISGHPLPAISHILSIVSVLWFACALFLIPKGALPEADFIAGTKKPSFVSAAPIIGTLSAAAISFTYYEPADLLGVLTQQHALDTTVICAFLTLIGVILSAAYYLLRVVNSPRCNGTVVVLGLGPIALMTGLCGLTYFELDHHMNAPAKIGMQLAWIATMLYLISELRVTLGKAQPRRYLSVASITLYANACACVPFFTTLPNADSIHSARIMGFALFCLCNCLYVGYRLIQFTSLCNAPAEPPAPSDDPIPEQTNGKDDQDGCQQQDSMAS